ncbi:MAG: zinc ribbon domain-containing protein [Myxococcota bacterium]
MLEGLKHLLELQRLDEEIASREDALALLPEQRRRLVESRDACTAKLAEARELLQAEEMRQRQSEAAHRDQEALLAKLEGQQFQVKDNAAYTALLSEMDRAKEAISECETRILEGMEAVEAARAALAGAEGDDRNTKSRVERDGQAIATREEKLTAEVAAFTGQREQVGPKLDAQILAAYERVASRRRPALVLVSDETCEGCRVGIPAQNYIEILKGERLITCGSCQRILLHPDMVS